MIERYSRPEMTRLWTDEYRFRKMLDVELLSTEALVKQKKYLPRPTRRFARKPKLMSLEFARLNAR
jgi:adenylosuccinate lyase